MRDLHITPMNIGYLRAQIGLWYDLPPEHPAAAQEEAVSLFCYHIAYAGRSVLVDAPSYDFPPEEEEMLIPESHKPSLLEQLATAGIAADDLTDVIITHAHFDHFNGLTYLKDGRYVPVFPNARHYLGKADWRPDRFSALEAQTLQVIHAAGLLTLVDGPYPITAGLTILPAPGETPGHQIVHVQHGSQEIYIVGDLYHHPLELTDPALHISWAAPVAMQASKAILIERAASSGATVFFTHIAGPYRVELVEQLPHWRAV